MGQRVLSFANAFVTPGSVLAIVVAWIATRPDMQLRLEQLWGKLLGGHTQPRAAGARIEPYGSHVTSLHVQVPVSKSRCKVTQAFRPIRLSVADVA